MTPGAALRGTRAGYDAERTKWDAHARYEGGGDLELPWRDFAEFAAACGTLVGVPELLGELAGKRVLEYGCGGGTCATMLARSGAVVTAFDVSPGSAELTRRRAEANGVEVETFVHPAEQLPYPDDSFDVVFGHAVLHHLDLEVARAELLRVLRPGGRAVFSEPIGTNPVLELIRRRVPYPGKTERGIDRPLRYEELRAWGVGFSEHRFRETQLLAMVERLFGHRRVFPRLTRADAFLLERLPFLRPLCRYALLSMVK